MSTENVLNTLDSNMTNFVKDIFIIPIEDINQNINLVMEIADSVKTSLNFAKKNLEY